MTVNEMWELYCEGAAEEVAAMDEAQRKAAFYELVVSALEAGAIEFKDILGM